MNFAEFLRTPILQNTSGRLLLYYQPAFLQGSSLDLILRSYDLGLNLGKNWKYIRAFWEICHQHKLKRQSISTKSWQYFAYKFSITLHEKCPNTEFFLLVRIFLYSDWILRFTEYNYRRFTYLDTFHAVLITGA